MPAAALDTDGHPLPDTERGALIRRALRLLFLFERAGVDLARAEKLTPDDTRELLAAMRMVDPLERCAIWLLPPGASLVMVASVFPRTEATCLSGPRSHAAGRASTRPPVGGACQAAKA